MNLLGSRFEILSLAGQGGMGKVFRARDLQTGDVVALKLLSLLDHDTSMRFERESEALARLEHPGIVRHVVHGKADDGVPYLAMAWVDGEELRVRLKREGVLEAAQVVTLGKRLASALAHAHARGIVHRDVKPSNVVLPSADLASAVIIDFGLARSDDDELTRTGMLVGTPIYMAPEQVRDNAVTPSVDVFALGCVMYQCLAQTTPFAANGATAVLTRVLFDEPVPLERIAPGVPHALAELVASMLRKNPSERPTMRDVEAGLGELDDGRATIPAAPKLSTAELRVVSVIALGAPAEVDEGATLRQIAAPSVDAEVLGAIAARHGARASTLPNGAAVVVLEAEGAASDLAARAAECALALKRAMPHVPVSLATGRAQTSEGLPLGEAIDRAVALPPYDGDAVRADDVTAGLLGARMTIEGGLLQRAHADRSEREQARTFLGKPAPCVGRDAELATLEGMIAQSANESVARVALVTGAPGVGKSRIRQEIVARCEQRGTNVWVGRADVTSAGVPFGILSQMIRSRAGIVQDDAPAIARDKLTARVARFVAREDALRVAAFLGEIAAVRFEDENVQLRAARSDPQLMGDQMQRAFVDFVEAECRDAPLVLVMEDLQWGDAPTIAAIDAALRVLEERPLAVIAFARPEVTATFAGLWEKRRVQPLPLAPLPKRAATRLARSVLGDKAPDDVVGALVEKADGNVFFLEELLRAEASGRAGEVPATVVAMVQSRLGALDADARRVLRAASILGGAFGGAGVRALLGDDRVDVDRWLGALVADEVLSARDTGHGVTYAFRHALVREGAYAMLTDDDRTLGHRLAAEWLARGDASPLVVASHYEQAGEGTKAAAAWLEAAEQSLESSDLVGAIMNAERGVKLGAAGELLGALRVVQAQAHHWRGETEAMQAQAAEAVSLLQPRDPRWADAMTLLAVGKQRLGSTSDLASVAEKLQAMLEREGGSKAALARAGGRVASLLFFAGKQDRAAAMLDAAEQAARDGGADVIARIHQARAPHARQAGRPEEALAHAEAAEEAFRAAGDLRNACMMSGIRGFALSELGAYEEAEGALNATLVTAERLGLTTVAATARSNLGMVCLRLGRAQQAETEERAAIRAFQASDRRHEGGARSYLALVLREAGALDQAENEARRALSLLDAALALKPLAAAVLASILLAAGRGAEALDVARDAMRWPESGNRIEEGESLLRLTLARALLATGHAEEARAALAVARARIMERAATIQRPDLRQKFLAAVPEHATTLQLASASLP